MRAQEKYWGFRAPDTPELRDLPEGVFRGTEQEWESLPPGYRREIYKSLTRKHPSPDDDRLQRADEKHEQSIRQIEKRASL